MADTYTHKELAELCSVSETTIKSYRRKFPGFIPVLTRGKPIRFKKDAGAVCLKIRDCFEKGMSVNETLKVLKEQFAEEPAPRGKAGGTRATGSVVSEAYLDKFFETAGQMMHGMAGLATAQAKSAHRLEKLESAVSKLIELETRNSEMFGKALERLAAQPAPEPAPSQPAAEPQTAESKVRARKIVNVKTPEGGVTSYSLEKEDTSETMERPTDAFLNTPIVIKNDIGEFLGVPGRLPVAGFVDILLRESSESGAAEAHWHRVGDDWVFTMKTHGDDRHALYFRTTTTPKGNLVVQLGRLDVNRKETSPQFLQEFFRQVKDKV